MSLRLTLLALLAVCASLGAAPAPARTLSGISMPDTAHVGGTPLHLNGMAIYRKFGFKVLVAGLYLPSPQHDAAAILASDSPRRYVTRFLRGVGAERVRSAWRKGLARNTPNASAEVKAEFRELNGWARDFREGEEIDVTYVPGVGSTVVIAGTQKGVLPGKGFSDAYLALALGREPSLGVPFKRRLLGAGAVRASAPR